MTTTTTAGQRFLADFETDYEADVDQHARLEAIAATMDLIERLEEQIAADGVTVRGSKAQPVLHPAIAEVRQQRLALSRLLSALGLQPESRGSRQARRAAEARWAK